MLNTIILILAAALMIALLYSEKLNNGRSSCR